MHFTLTYANEEEDIYVFVIVNIIIFLLGPGIHCHTCSLSCTLNVYMHIYAIYLLQGWWIFFFFLHSGIPQWLIVNKGPKKKNNELEWTVSELSSNSVLHKNYKRQSKFPSPLFDLRACMNLLLYMLNHLWWTNIGKEVMR